MLKSRKFLIITTQKRADKYMKIYNYEGRKNLCGEKIKLARTKNASLKETWPPACKLKESQ